MGKVSRRAVISLPLALALPCAARALTQTDVMRAMCQAAWDASKVALPFVTPVAVDGWGLRPDAGAWVAYASCSGRELSHPVPGGVDGLALGRALHKLLRDAGADPVEQLGIVCMYSGAGATLYCRIRNLTCEPALPRGEWFTWALSLPDPARWPAGIAWVGAPLAA